VVDLTATAVVDLPAALAELRHGLHVGARVDARLPDDERVATVVEAAAFDRDGDALVARFGLPDHVGPDMRLLCCGLNPSVHAADAGVGYVTGSNRFWRAMAVAGLATEPLRDPLHLLRVDHVGMTDIVKRPTPRADELTTAEYRTGVERLAALCSWLQPKALAMVGLAGWRAAVDRRAAVGWQPEPLGGVPVYVLPSTSGLNARVTLPELAEHLRTAAG
jgi:TDG/mug DNA glycosylase family protein